MYAGKNRGAIVTLTANPSLDRTVELSGVLVRGAVQRAAGVHEEPGGKGVNVCRALAASGFPAVAVLPGDNADPVMQALRTTGIAHRNLPIGAPLRANLTLTETDGTTTKINLPGPELGAAVQESLLALAVDACGGPEGTDPASWLVLAGSLPPGVPADYYAVVAHALRARFEAAAPRLAIDSSGPPLLGALLHDAAPDLLKPNGEELAEVTGVATGDELEADPSLAAGAALTLVERGVGAVLATLGARGALLVTADGARRYGVVCSEKGMLDDGATAELRTQLRATREEPLPLFNRGGELSDLLANSLTETGLAAPTPPVAML